MTTAPPDELVARRAGGTGDQPGPADAGARFRAGRPARGLGGDGRDHRAGGGDQNGEPGLAHRCRHPDLRREALRPTGVADAAQPRRGGQPRVWLGRSSAGGQTADRDRRGPLRLQRAGLAIHWRSTRRCHGGAGRPDRPTDQPFDAGRRDRRTAAHRRRGQLCGRAHRAARRVPGVLRGRRVRRTDRRPGSGAGTHVCRADRRPQR